MPDPLTLSQAFVAAASSLRHAGIDTPELDARLLLCHAAALSHEAYIARPGAALEPPARARLDAAIARRLEHEPVARIVGTREFYGRSFGVDPSVLDPRADTETLIEAALAIVDRQGWRARPLRLLDLGTGSGCILLTLLAELSCAQGIGTDISPAALACAAATASRLGVAARAGFIAANWLDAASGRFDLILANPPYIASGEIAGLAADVVGYDPRIALDGGPDGLEAYREIAARAGGALAEQGQLLLEIGQTQADAVAEMLRAAGLKPQAIGQDLAGRPRVVVAGW
ncbi:MAG: peptide chain release factor N(5)-glutamine methyltransferase [Methyloceanibacter sp.]